MGEFVEESAQVNHQVKTTKIMKQFKELTEIMKEIFLYRWLIMKAIEVGRNCVGFEYYWLYSEEFLDAPVSQGRS